MAKKTATASGSRERRSLSKKRRGSPGVSNARLNTSQLTARVNAISRYSWYFSSLVGNSTEAGDVVSGGVGSVELTAFSALKPLQRGVLPCADAG
jgi:hypothetical protein